jgi:hypothetical protein
MAVGKFNGKSWSGSKTSARPSPDSHGKEVSSALGISMGAARHARRVGGLGTSRNVPSSQQIGSSHLYRGFSLRSRNKGKVSPLEFWVWRSYLRPLKLPLWQRSAKGTCGGLGRPGGRKVGKLEKGLGKAPPGPTEWLGSRSEQSRNAP